MYRYKYKYVDCSAQWNHKLMHIKLINNKYQPIVNRRLMRKFTKRMEYYLAIKNYVVIIIYLSIHPSKLFTWKDAYDRLLNKKRYEIF